MPWLVAKRPLAAGENPSAQYQFRVFNEQDIEGIGPEWDWASISFMTREEAEREADELFWSSLDN